MTHASAVQAAGQRVIERAVLNAARGIGGVKMIDAVDAYNALVAAQCATCGGTGKKLALTAAEEALGEWEDERGMVVMPCPAGCDEGRTR